MVAENFENKKSFASNNRNGGGFVANSVAVTLSDKTMIYCDMTNSNKRTQYQEDSRRPTESACWDYAGIICCLLSSLTMSVTSLIVKLLPGYHPFTLTIWRYVGNVIPSIPILIYYAYWENENIFSPIWPLVGRNYAEERKNLYGLWAGGIFGGAVTVFRFCALRYLSLADVSVITRSTPALVLILAYFFLDEKCSVVSIVSAALAISGVFVLSRPPFLTGNTEFDSETLIGLGLSIAALACSSVTIIMARKLRKVNFALMIFAFGLVGILEGAFLSWSIGTFKLPEGLRDILLTVLLSGLTFIGQWLSVLAVKFDGAGPISIVKTSYLLFAFVWQIVFLQLFPDMISILGASIVLAGIAIMALRKWVRTMPEDNKLRNNLICLTK